jgi:hypothetical protein
VRNYIPKCWDGQGWISLEVRCGGASSSRFFTEARSYAEKANVVDYVEDRIEFARTGRIQTRHHTGPLNLGRVARAARRILEAAREISGEPPVTFPAWRLVDRMRYIHREIAQRENEVVRTVRGRIELRAKERAVAREWDISR